MRKQPRITVICYTQHVPLRLSSKRPRSRLTVDLDCPLFVALRVTITKFVLLLHRTWASAFLASACQL